MRRWLVIPAALLALAPAGAIDTGKAFDDPELQARYEKLISEVRCLKCQNQSIKDSNVFLASDLRREIRRMIAEGKTDPDVCRVVWQTPTYADYNWTVHPAVETLFEEGFTDRIRKALLEMSDPKLLAAVGRKKLIPAKNEEFEGIRKVAEKLDMMR